MLTKIGVCNNCGECCYIYNNESKEFHWCDMYSFTRPNGHCLIHNKHSFPKECAGFPRSPDDLDRVKGKCCIRFVDERGRIVDSWMNPTVNLVKAPK